MRQSIRFVAPITLLVVASTILSARLARKSRSNSSRPPMSTAPQVHAKGDQVYTCKADAAQFTWTLKAPDAQLFDEKRKNLSANISPEPSWEANDGSRVTGKAVATHLRPTPIPFPGSSSTSSPTKAPAVTFPRHNHPAPQHQRRQSTSLRLRCFPRRPGSPRALHRRLPLLQPQVNLLPLLEERPLCR